MQDFFVPNFDFFLCYLCSVELNGIVKFFCVCLFPERLFIILSLLLWKAGALL